MIKYYHAWFQTKLKKFLLVDIIDARIHDFKTNNFWARRYGSKEVPPEGIQTTINYILDQKKDLHVI